jgi:hypothetical protein
MNNFVLDRIARALRRPRVRTRVYAAIAVAAVVASACSVYTMSETGLLASIAVTPNGSVDSASTRQMRAMGLDVNGRIVNIAPTWSVAGGGGTINTDGMFTSGAGAAGTTVVASAHGISGRAFIAATRSGHATTPFVR